MNTNTKKYLIIISFFSQIDVELDVVPVMGSKDGATDQRFVEIYEQLFDDGEKITIYQDTEWKTFCYTYRNGISCIPKGSFR